MKRRPVLNYQPYARPNTYTHEPGTDGYEGRVPDRVDTHPLRRVIALQATMDDMAQALQRKRVAESSPPGGLDARGSAHTLSTKSTRGGTA